MDGLNSHVQGPEMGRLEEGGLGPELKQVKAMHSSPTPLFSTPLSAPPTSPNPHMQEVDEAWLVSRLCKTQPPGLLYHTSP